MALHMQPAPLAAGPQPMGTGVLRVQKQMYRDWLGAGGTPPIYTPVTPSAAATAAQLFGRGFTSAEAASLLTALKALTNASFAITVNGTLTQATPMNLTAAADLAAIAALIGSNTAGCACSWGGSCFVISTTTTGATSTLSFAVAPAAGTDISVTAGLAAATGAFLTQGADAIP